MSQSRYAGLPTGLWTAPDGRQIPYLRRRLLPAAGSLATERLHVVVGGERPDTIAAVELGDPELSWLLADANPVMRPRELVEAVGSTIAIPLPGIPGPANGQ